MSKLYVCAWCGFKERVVGSDPLGAWFVVNPKGATQINLCSPGCRFAFAENAQCKKADGYNLKESSNDE